MRQPPGKQSVRVLIVDDSDTTRLSLRVLLSLEPAIQVAGEAANGQHAIALVAEVQPDVVLIDGKMPIMDGVEATQLIKRWWPEIKVIMLTMSPTYQARAIAAGADVCLLKDGNSIDVLRDVILEVQSPK